MLTLAVTVLQWCLAKESRASLAVSNELKNMAKSPASKAEIAYIELQLVLGNHFQGVHRLAFISPVNSCLYNQKATSHKLNSRLLIW
jgi:hypothetical protein